MIHLRTVLCRTVFVLAAVGSFAYGQGTNINIAGTFEADLPSFWTKGSAPSGSTLSWATDQYRSMGHSLKIVKSATGDSSAWISENMADIWSPKHFKDVDIKLGAWIKTSGVNTSPVSDDQKWWVSYTFYDSAGVLIGETKLPVDQTVATRDWYADTNGVGVSTLPKDSWKTIVKFVGGKNATGTVWAGDFLFYGRAGAWAGQDWNTGVGVPTGWYYWLPPIGGNDGVLDAGFENTVVTTEAAHSGLQSLKFNLPFGRRSQDGFVGTKRQTFNNIDAGVNDGDVLRISVWLKASNLVPDSAAKYPGAWAVGFTPLWFTGVGNNLGYDPPVRVGPANDYTFAFPAVTQFEWTQYTLDVTVPAGVGAHALEVRLHAYSQFTGTIYWDDLTVQKLDAAPINAVGGFESDLPSFWTKGSAPSGSTLSWATDQYRSMGHSLKIVKSATGDSSAWISENMADIWSPKHFKDVDIKLGAWIKTSGVNTSPVSDDQKWWVSYTFYDSAGVLIGETKLPVDQTVATRDWYADTNGVGVSTLPKDSWKTIVKFVGGKNATGTVWAGDFLFYGRAGAWAGQDWNTGVGVPTGWYYWLPPIGGNDGVLDAGFENTVVTTEAAHSGLRSLKFNLPFGRRSQDGFVAVKRMLLNGVDPSINDGDVLRISVWLKASNLVPDSAAKYPGAWAVGFTPLWFTGVGNNLGYDPPVRVGPANDYTFAFPAVTQFEWTQYTLDVTVPAGVGAHALEVRLHAYSQFTGTIYWDDLTVQKLDAAPINAVGGFESDLPSFWTKGSAPSGSTLSWATDQYRSMGHSLKIVKSATGDSSAWISENMADIWSPKHFKDVDIKLGAWIKTSGVNTSPVSDDQKWWVSYTFYDSAGVLIGETKLPVDQTVATRDWYADTNGVGVSTLPKDSWKTIVKFVGGKNATGTVWAGDFLFYGRAGAWAGQDWNTGVGVPTGWYYWLPPIGGNDGVLDAGFENTVVTTEAAHSGLQSLKFNLPFGRRSQDGFVGTHRYLVSGTAPGGFAQNRIQASPGDISALQEVKDGDVLRIGVWLKASNLVPDSAAKYPGAWAVGFTPLWFTGVGNNLGYDPPVRVGPANDYTFVFPAVTQFDWTRYTLDVVVPAGVNAKALEVRLHVYSQFTGTIYWDDLTVEVIGSVTAVKNEKDGIPKTFELSANYPNPFNPSTNIHYGVPRDGSVSLIIYNILGQQVRTLVDMPHSAGQYSISWDGRDDAGLTMGTGVYFYRLQAGTTNLVKKMLLLK